VSQNPLQSYEKLQAIFYKDIRSPETRQALEECFTFASEFLARVERVELGTPARKKPRRQRQGESLETLAQEHPIRGKQYFAFHRGKRISRAVNKSLYSPPSLKKWRKLVTTLDRGDVASAGMTAKEITKLIYSVAMSFCCAIDLLKRGDQQRPGTFFGYLISHLVASRFGVNPQRELPLVNIEVESHLPTDFTFDVPGSGGRRRKFHLPLKTSTRERAIQIFAHQAMLDNAHGRRIFAAIPVILGETKTDQNKREVIEICLPKQWRLYQRHLAHLARVYYLDIPEAYRQLSHGQPPIIVKEFGEFFFEADELAP
jgi:hypothetical protein